MRTMASAAASKLVAGGDLELRGFLDETIVAWATASGCSPGGGIKAGMVDGATDEIGFHAVKLRHCVTDIHATVDYGKPITELHV